MTVVRDLLHVIAAVAIVVIAMAASTKPASAAQQRGRGQSAGPVNPLLSPSPLPFHAPPFDKLKDADFQPAIEQGIKLQRTEILKIANNPAAPTFDNTIVALEKSGQLLARAYMVFNGLAGANTNDTLQKVQEDVAPKLAAVQDEMYLNDKLFARVDRKSVV